MKPILDTTAAIKIKAGMWCECDENTHYGHRCGELEHADDGSSSLVIRGCVVSYGEGTLPGNIKNLRVYEHKPQPEYPTEEGFYRFEGTVYRMIHDELENDVWQAVFDVESGVMHRNTAGIYTERMMRLADG